MHKLYRLIVGTCGICLLVACGSRMTDEQIIDSARTHIDKGELSTASIELKNLLQENGENVKAHALLAEVHLSAGNYASAEKEIQRANELGATDDDTLPILAKALLAQGAVAELNALSAAELMSNEAKSQLFAAQALGKLQQLNMVEAEALVDQAVALSPDSVYALVAKARLLSVNKQYLLGRKELDRIFELDATYAPAWSLLGDLEIQDKNQEAAEAAYTKAIDYRVDNLGDLLKRAQLRVQSKQYQLAQDDIDVLSRRYPALPQVNYLQGLLYSSNNQLSDALNAYDRALMADNQYWQALYMQSVTNLRLGNLERASELCNQYLKLIPNSIPGRKLLASINIQNQEYEHAEETIRPVADFQVDDLEALNLLADALLHQNTKSKTEEAIELLEQIAGLEPDSATAHLRLGTALLSAKREEGFEHIKQASQLNPALDYAHILIVHTYLDQKKYSMAMAAAEQFQQIKPQSPVPYDLIGRIYLDTDREADAIKAFRRAIELAPGDPIANHSLAALAVRQGKNEEAVSYYENILKYDQNNVSALVGLAQIAEMQKDGKLTLEYLKRAVEGNSSSVSPKIFLAKYYIAHGDPEKVGELLVGLSREQRQKPQVLEVLALSQLEQKEFKKARQTLAVLIKKHPDYYLAHVALAKAHAGLGDTEKARNELRTAIELAPNSVEARLGLARLLLVERRVDEAAIQINKLNELAPENSDVMRLTAILAMYAGNEEEALNLLEGAFESSPSTTSMLVLASQMSEMGDPVGALKLQESWAMEHLDDPLAQITVANTYILKNQSSQAISKYYEILSKDENNVVALNNLAWLLRDENPEKALEFSERAAKSAPGSANVMDTHAFLLLKNNELERAKRSIERALAKAPNNPTMKYHDAMIDAASGNQASAISNLQTLLAEGVDFPEKSDAEELLASLQLRE
jgi:putative PEP-CTERM system TPR-repeat lipoprotein